MRGTPQPSAPREGQEWNIFGCWREHCGPPVVMDPGGGGGLGQGEERGGRKVQKDKSSIFANQEQGRSDAE